MSALTCNPNTQLEWSNVWLSVATLSATLPLTVTGLHQLTKRTASHRRAHKMLQAENLSVVRAKLAGGAVARPRGYLGTGRIKF